MTTNPPRVFQVATGNVGREMIKRLGPHPDLELVGVHVYTPDKVGRDVGELAGIGPVGIRATGTVEEIIYCGDHNRVHVRLGESDLMVCKLPNSSGHQRPSQGSVIDLTWKTDDCKILAPFARDLP